MSDEYDIFLTDQQYLDILYMIQKKVNEPNFEPFLDDSNEIGQKHTKTNCGLCSDDFTTEETAMFPEEFPQRKDIKYSEDYQKCPFDWRKNPDMNGCFRFCWLFKRHLTDAEKIKKLVNEQIDFVLKSGQFEIKVK